MDTAAIVPGERVTFWVDGQAIEARLGQTVGAALLAQGVRVLRRTRRRGRPRGLFCAMGICYDCVVSVDGQTGLRACVTPVRAGMRVSLPVRFEPQRTP